MKKDILTSYFGNFINLVEVTDVTLDEYNNVIVGGNFDYDEKDPIKGYQFEIKIDSEGNTYFRNCGYSNNCFWTEWN